MNGQPTQFNPLGPDDWANIQECRNAIPVLLRFADECEQCNMSVAKQRAELLKSQATFNAMAKYFVPGEQANVNG